MVGALLDSINSLVDDLLVIIKSKNVKHMHETVILALKLASSEICTTRSFAFVIIYAINVDRLTTFTNLWMNSFLVLTRLQQCDSKISINQNSSSNSRAAVNRLFKCSES